MSAYHFKLAQIKQLVESAECTLGFGDLKSTRKKLQLIKELTNTQAVGLRKWDLYGNQINRQEAHAFVDQEYNQIGPQERADVRVDLRPSPPHGSELGFTREPMQDFSGLLQGQFTDVDWSETPRAATEEAPKAQEESTEQVAQDKTMQDSSAEEGQSLEIDFTLDDLEKSIE